MDGSLDVDIVMKSADKTLALAYAMAEYAKRSTAVSILPAASDGGKENR